MTEPAVEIEQYYEDGKFVISIKIPDGYYIAVDSDRLSSSFSSDPNKRHLNTPLAL